MEIYNAKLPRKLWKPYPYSIPPERMETRGRNVPTGGGLGSLSILLLSPPLWSDNREPKGDRITSIPSPVTLSLSGLRMGLFYVGETE